MTSKVSYGPLGGQTWARVIDSNGLYRLAVDATINPASTADGNPSVDSFSRSRVSNPASIFDAKQIYDDQPLLFSTNTAGGGTATYVQAKAATVLDSGLVNGARATRQTKRYLNYQPGKSQLVFATFNMNGAVANAEKRVGYFDNDNGIFLRLTGSGVSLVLRSSVSGAPVDQVVPQTAWNVDKLNGTGDSGVDLDLTKVQILVIDFQWLGVGAVRVGFDIAGSIYYAHTFKQANLGTTVYSQTPNLPVRWEVSNTGVPLSNPALDAICCSVQSEGGASPLSVQRTASRGVSGASASTTTQSMFSIRLKSAYKRATVFPLNGSVVTTDTGIDYFGQLILNPTFGAALSFSPVSNSSIEYSNTVTTATGGTVLSEFYGISASPGKSGSALVTTSANLNSVLALASDYAGVQDVVTIAVRTLTGTTTSSMYAWIDWLELL